MDESKKIEQPKKNPDIVSRASLKLTQWVGTPQSIIVHTILFGGIFVLVLFGFTVEQVMLILTTVVSLEAIYLSLFIQMTVNRNTASLKDVTEDLGEIQEDVKDLEEDFGEIQEDVGSMEDNIEKIHGNVEDMDKNIDTAKSEGEFSGLRALLEKQLSKFNQELETLKEQIESNK